MMDQTETQRILRSSDEQLRQWDEQHHRYEERLMELANKSTLSPEEELEEKELKKRKLYLKDQMVAKLRNETAPA